MKVFGCYRQKYGKEIVTGGMCIATGNNVEEAYKAFIEDIRYIPFHMPVYGKDELYLSEKSIDYPLEKWFEMTELTANCDKARVLYENSIKL